MPSSKLVDISPITTWCPGCGNFGTWQAVKQALNELGIAPHQIITVFDIGCAGNGCNFWGTNTFHGLHGRPLPIGVGIKIANKELTVLVSTGDGGGYGEGGNHLIHTMRTNIELTCLVHNNQVYGLTTGQYSPSSDTGYVSKTSLNGTIEAAFNPLAIAIGNGATFVARGFAGDIPHLASLISQGVQHKGFAIIDILQPCVTFNKINTFAWYKERVYKLEDEGYQPDSREKAFSKALEWGEKIPIGLFYKEDRPTYHDQVRALAGEPLAMQKPETPKMEKFYKEFK